jgi:hypothetical protein
MAEIPNFPQDLLHLHHAWHRHDAHPELPGRMIEATAPGGGLEFLTFHRDFVRRVHEWLDVQPFAGGLDVAPWLKIPADMKVPQANWTDVLAAQERRLDTNNPPYASADELGRDIELGIHNQWLHTAAADIFGDELVRSPATSPQSTFFYKIHGLVDHWWMRWFPDLSAKSVVKDVNDIPTKVIVKDTQDKTVLKDVSDVPTKVIVKDVHDSKTIVKDTSDVPHKFKESEVPHTPPDLDRLLLVELVTGLTQRVQALESEVARGRAFIRPEERPDVGGAGGDDRGDE